MDKEAVLYTLTVNILTYLCIPIILLGYNALTVKFICWNCFDERKRFKIWKNDKDVVEVVCPVCGRENICNDYNFVPYSTDRSLKYHIKLAKLAYKMNDTDAASHLELLTKSKSYEAMRDKILKDG